jgi:hypothetical protein
VIWQAGPGQWLSVSCSDSKDSTVLRSFLLAKHLCFNSTDRQTHAWSRLTLKKEATKPAADQNGWAVGARRIPLSRSVHRLNDLGTFLYSLDNFYDAKVR